VIERVLITGAAGHIGRDLRAGLRRRYRLLRLLDVADQEPAEPGEEVVRADVTDDAALDAAMAGMDAVVHLAATPIDAPFDAILAPNIVGTQRVFDAARDAGVRRIVFASSHHTGGFYPRSRVTGPSDPPRPDSHYAVSKLFGEAVGRLYADKYGLEVACIRILAWADRPRAPRHLDSWLSPRDGVELVRCCLEAPALRFAVIFGVSANTRACVRNDDLGWLGWTPRDDAERFAAELDDDEPEGLAKRLYGGPFIARDHDPRFDR
jgi:uronate dehydrogenase